MFTDDNKYLHKCFDCIYIESDAVLIHLKTIFLSENSIKVISFLFQHSYPLSQIAYQKYFLFE